MVFLGLVYAMSLPPYSRDRPMRPAMSGAWAISSPALRASRVTVRK